jgi:hypothetical protein
LSARASRGRTNKVKSISAAADHAKVDFLASNIGFSLLTSSEPHGIRLMNMTNRRTISHER